jgi:rod shape-determining protein MreC
MHWILQFFLSHRKVTSLLVTCALSLWMLAAGEVQQCHIARVLTMYVLFPIQWTLDLTTRAGDIWAENKRLKERVAELNTRLAVLEEASAEHERLRQLVGFKAQSQLDLVPVRVVAREPSHQFRSIVIDAGRDQGIERHMPVVDGRGLIGKVVHVLPHLSLVQLLRDPLSRTSVISRHTRVVGILEQEGKTSLCMRHRASAEIDTADTVVTSGLGGVFPKGLPVGRVIEILDDDDPLFSLARVEPFVDFNKLEEAFVMRLSPQWSAFRGELDSLEVTP